MTIWPALGVKRQSSHASTCHSTSDAAKGMDAQLIAAVEQHICTTAEVFFGTQTSNFSLVIRTLRDHSGIETSMDIYMNE